jgi:hypothetical protein
VKISQWGKGCWLCRVGYDLAPKQDGMQRAKYGWWQKDCDDKHQGPSMVCQVLYLTLHGPILVMGIDSIEGDGLI